jgi:nitrite reductase/ring-hydroxylating ferredoxin subunit
MGWHRVAGLGEIQPGKPKIVTVGNKEIGIFFEQSHYYAVLNICPHNRSEICKGRVTGTLLADCQGGYELQSDNLVLRCPWHHWEFHLDTGKAVIPSVRQRMMVYPVKIEEQSVYIHISSGKDESE